MERIKRLEEKLKQQEDKAVEKVKPKKKLEQMISRDNSGSSGSMWEVSQSNPGNEESNGTKPTFANMAKKKSGKSPSIIQTKEGWFG